jgi:hypothetical protein
MNWERLNKLRADSVLRLTGRLVAEARYLRDELQDNYDTLSRNLSVYTAGCIAEIISEADGVTDFWAHMLYVLHMNGAMAPGGSATASAQKTYMKLLTQVDKLLADMHRIKKRMDKKRVAASHREAKAAAKKARRRVNA